MLRSIVPLAAILSFTLGSPAAAVRLSTPLDANNDGSGIMFDIVAGQQALTMLGGAISLDAGAWNLELYTRPGTVVGNLGAPGWTLISGVNGINGSGRRTQTFFDFTDFNVAANSTTGVYIYLSNGPGLNYTNGTAVGAVVASDANLSILSGFGRTGSAFGAVFSPRNFNGSLVYAVNLATGVPEPENWAMMIAGFGLMGALSRRRRAVAAA